MVRIHPSLQFGKNLKDTHSKLTFTNPKFVQMMYLVGFYKRKTPTANLYSYAYGINEAS